MVDGNDRGILDTQLAILLGMDGGTEDLMDHLLSIDGESVRADQYWMVDQTRHV